jgi:hypothetical protein
MTKIFVLLGIIFYCTATYAKNDPICNVSTRGGQYVAISVTDSTTGESVFIVSADLRYDYTYIHTNQNTNVTTIICKYPGQTPCPGCPNKSVPPVVYDEVIERVQNEIDWGHTAGEFSLEGFVCTWDEGSKEIQILDGIEYPIYSYNLEIADANSVIPDDLEIQISPNPVQNHILVSFSMPINGMMNVKIVDVMGTIRWNSNMYVSDSELSLTATISSLQSGTYYVVCTNNEYTAYAPFVKQ